MYLYMHRRVAETAYETVRHGYLCKMELEMRFLLFISSTAESPVTNSRVQKIFNCVFSFNLLFIVRVFVFFLNLGSVLRFPAPFPRGLYSADMREVYRAQRPTFLM